MSLLNNHPFAVEAFFKKSIVLTFAVEKEQLAALLPESLSLDTHNDRWGFIAVALVDTTGLRPKGFPPFLGNDFFLVGYRIFTRFQNAAGKQLRGLFILKSETNKRKMERLGSIFTKYKYDTTDITHTEENNCTIIHSVHSGFHVKMLNMKSDIPLPEHSPFAHWKEARRFAGPLPFTFSYDAKKRKMLIIEGVRQNWTPIPVKIIDYCFPYLTEIGLGQATLANAFEINNIPYYWKKGKTEEWTG